MSVIRTDLGKIYASYNEETDDFDKFRVINIVDDKYAIGTLNDDYTVDDENVKILSKEEFETFSKDHVRLESDGIVTISNITAAKADNGSKIKDICMIFFKNDESKVPDSDKPTVVARQAINNIYEEMYGKDVAGVSVTLNTLPNDYTLGDFMYSLEVDSSRAMHIYKIDTPMTINEVLNTDATEEILKNLYDMSVFRKKTLGELPEDYEETRSENDCVDGYCNNLLEFINVSGFYNDVLMELGIIPIDKELEENVELDEDDKMLLTTLCGGGIVIHKAVPLKFEYDINLEAIKMNYVLTRNVSGEGYLYIVPYTSSPYEIDTKPLYEMNEERLNRIHNRLMSIVKAYDESVGNQTKTGKELVDFMTE